MFELPEVLTLARQMNETLEGKVIVSGSLGNSPHKFVWYNRTHEEFAAIVPGKVVGEARARGRWLLVSLEPGYVLVLGELGGKMLYHQRFGQAPAKYHLLMSFDDGSALSLMTQMWGAMELYEKGQEEGRQYIRDMRPVPGDPTFTSDYFSSLVDDLIHGEKRSVKGLLTQDQLIPGLGNAIAQDIMFSARLHPRRPLASLDAEECDHLYRCIIDTVASVTELGGRYDEVDLFGRPGGYQRIMDRNAVARPCPVCGQMVLKLQYLGGSCYVCPGCQPEP